MSLFPSPVLVKLQELKLWQGTYDSLLQNRSKDGTNPSDFDTIEGISALDSNHSSPLTSPERDKVVDWDKKAISPSKPFEQLLEEKLALDKPVHIQAKPKRPFLKKGSGLTRYRLSEQPPPPRRRPRDKATVEKTRRSEPVKSRKHSPKILKTQKQKPCRELKKQATQIEITPLKMPDVMIKSKATWQKVLEERGNLRENQSSAFADNLSIFKNSFNSQIIDKINDFNLKRFLPLSPHRSLINKQYSESITPIPEVEIEKTPSIDDQKSHEKLQDTELRIFEALEERVEHSSFSSTNSSIIRLLSSTPSKVKNKVKPKSPILEEWNFLERDKIASGSHVHGIQSAILQSKLMEVNKRTDVLHDFLKNLRKMGDSGDKASNVSSLDSAHDKTRDTSFSDEEKWSSTTETDRSQSPSTYFSDNEMTFKGDSVLKVDAAVNTSLEKQDECIRSEKCQNCEELQIKLDKLSKQLPDIQAEKARVCDFAKELEEKRDQLYRDMERMKLKYEDEIAELKEDMENDRKKFAREKQIFDMYVKDSHNRPSRKEREEISDMKRELAETKELLKLKESKTGATQARLRNQIKLLERENSDLKLEVEKLQKENSKLTANQLMRRPSEVKMLHEINKNLTKLTEETLKKQMNKTDTSCNTEDTEEFKKVARKSKDGNNENKEREASPKVKRKGSCLTHKTVETDTQNNPLENSKHDMTTFANLSLEKQYENVFGQFTSPGVTNNSLNDSRKDRTETMFEDGSKEVKYSNGNTKTISPDGNIAIVKYYNGDIKETNLIENTLKYYYAENATWHIQHADGLEVLEYPNGQKETIYKSGKREVRCADGSFMIKNVDGTEEIQYPDGSKIMKHRNGEKILLLPNGQKEIHTKEHKRREYPDGTVKILYPDGSQETRYASGRVRIKDVNGVLIIDTQNPINS